MKTRLYISITLLLATIVIAFGLPKPRYKSPEIISQLDIPTAMGDWHSEDVSEQLNLQKDDRYAFISDVFARQYSSLFGGRLLFLVLDAGNFHGVRKDLDSALSENLFCKRARRNARGRLSS